MRDMPEHERPLSERFRIAGKVWAATRKTHRSYKERSRIVFDELVIALLECARDNGERLTRAAAEAEARTSSTWKKYVDDMLQAEHQANLAEVEKKALDMEHWELKDANANAREEKRSYRLGG